VQAAEDNHFMAAASGVASAQSINNATRRQAGAYTRSH